MQISSRTRASIKRAVPPRLPLQILDVIEKQQSFESKTQEDVQSIVLQAPLEVPKDLGMHTAEVGMSKWVEQKLRNLPGNDKCCDCGVLQPQCVGINHFVFVGMYQLCWRTPLIGCCEKPRKISSTRQLVHVWNYPYVCRRQRQAVCKPLLNPLRQDGISRENPFQYILHMHVTTLRMRTRTNVRWTPNVVYCVRMSMMMTSHQVLEISSWSERAVCVPKAQQLCRHVFIWIVSEKMPQTCSFRVCSSKSLLLPGNSSTSWRSN